MSIKLQLIILYYCGRRRFDIKWAAAKAEGSFTDARGDIIISHEHITINSSSVAFELYSKVQTSYHSDYWLEMKDAHPKNTMPFTVGGVELNLRMRGFEFFSPVYSYPFDSPKPVHLKATGRIKFQGKVSETSSHSNDHSHDKHEHDFQTTAKESIKILIGEVSISGLKLNQLMLAPQLAGPLRISRDYIKVKLLCFVMIAEMCSILIFLEINMRDLIFNKNYLRSLNFANISVYAVGCHRKTRRKSCSGGNAPISDR